MPNLYATIFEGLMYALLAWTLPRAWRAEGAAGVQRVLAGIAYGLLLEEATIRQLRAYTYGRFWVMVTDDVPLAIGVGWGLILNAAWLYTRGLAHPSWLMRATVGALWALTIDLAMDVVAIRLGFWDWGFGLDFDFFGVPWANFWAWFWVVGGYLAMLEGLQRLGWGIAAIRPWLAVSSVALVLLTNALITQVVPRAGYRPTVAAVLLAALAWTGLARGWRRVRAVPQESQIIQAAFHGYFTLAGLISGALFRPPALLVVAALAAGLGFALTHQPPHAKMQDEDG
ncbi:MAG: carotenoid biosynthesis protein [Chloroflexi bacterium]|nr:carotenoid biosynthesis protein [Chloroflexota bacterium]